MLLALETLFVVAIVAGVALVSISLALILGGVAGVLACERQSARVSRGKTRSA